MTFYDRLRKLLDWRAAPETRVVSLYLDLTRPPEQIQEDISESWYEAGDIELFHDDDRALSATYKLLEDRLPDEIEQAQAAGYDGLAVFFCHDPPLEEFFRLRFGLEVSFEVSHEPQTWQLAYYEEEYEQAVALTLGDRPEVAEIHVGDAVATHPVRPSHGRSPEQEARASLHLLLHDSPRAHLIVLGPPAARARQIAALDPALRARIIGEIDEPLSASDPGFLRAIHRVQQAYERRSEAAGVRALLAARERQDDQHPVAAGPAQVIEAINQGRVEKLYLLQSFDARCWICDACDRLGLPPEPPACTACGASVGRASLQHHMIQQARACGAEIETVHESEDLASLGGAAAELQAPAAPLSGQGAAAPPGLTPACAAAPRGSGRGRGRR